MERDTKSSESNNALRIHLLTPVCPSFDQIDTFTTPSLSLSPVFARPQGSLHLEAVASIDASKDHILSAL